MAQYSFSDSWISGKHSQNSDKTLSNIKGLWKVSTLLSDFLTKEQNAIQGKCGNDHSKLFTNADKRRANGLLTGEDTWSYHFKPQTRKLCTAAMDMMRMAEHSKMNSML